MCGATSAASLISQIRSAQPLKLCSALQFAGQKNQKSAAMRVQRENSIYLKLRHESALGYICYCDLELQRRSNALAALNLVFTTGLRIEKIEKFHWEMCEIDDCFWQAAWLELTKAVYRWMILITLDGRAKCQSTVNHKSVQRASLQFARRIYQIWTLLKWFANFDAMQKFHWFFVTNNLITDVLSWRRREM